MSTSTNTLCTRIPRIILTICEASSNGRSATRDVDTPLLLKGLFNNIPNCTCGASSMNLLPIVGANASDSLVAMDCLCSVVMVEPCSNVCRVKLHHKQTHIPKFMGPLLA